MKGSRNSNGRRKARQARRQRRQVRRERRDAKSAENFRKPLTGKRAGKVARKQAGLEFNPVIRTIKADVRGSHKREGQLDDWYGGLDQAAAQNLDTSRAAAGSARAATDKRIADQAAANAELLKGLGEEDAARAKLLGGQANTGALAGAAAGLNMAQQQAIALAAPNDIAQAAREAQIGTNRTAFKLGGIEAKGAEAERRRKIKQDLTAARRERGASTAANLQRLREGERDYDIQQRAFTEPTADARANVQVAKLNLQGSKAKSSAQVQAASIYSRAKERGSSAQEEVARLHREGKHDIAKALENQAKTYGSRSGPDKKERRNAMAAAKSLFREAGGARSAQEWNELERLLREESEVSPSAARWAIQRLKRRRGGRANRRQR